MKTLLPFFNRIWESPLITNYWYRISAILLFISSFTSVATAQNKIWDKTIGGSGDDRLTAVQQTSDGGYILGGYSDSDISGDKSQANKGSGDYWIVKLNANGTKVWDKTIGGRDYDVFQSLQQTSDGGYILGGYSYSGIGGDKSEANRGKCTVNLCNSDYWVVKIDANGNKLWDKTYGGSESEGLTSIKQTSDGGYILGGHSESGISGDKTQPSKGWRDFWVVKINANGDKIWDKSFGEENYDDLVSLVITSDGGYLLAGNFYGDARIIKLKADGTKLWEKSIGTNSITSFEPTSDGGYILGYTPTPYPAHYGIIKLKADGSQVWNKTFGGNGSDWLTSLQQTSDGGYIIGGYSDSGISGDKTEHVQGSCNDDECDSDYWVIKLKADGTKEWDKTIGGNNHDALALLQQTKDGGYILSGSSGSGISGAKSEASRGGYSDYWVVKLDNTVRRNQNIAFAPIVLNKALGDPPFTLSAQASSGLPVTFRVVSGPATVSGNKVTLTGIGTVNLQAYQAGNARYNSAVADQSFIVEETKLVKKQWNKTYGGDNRDALSAMIATADGGYLVGGYSNSGKTGDKSSLSKGAKDYWLAKLNSQGTKLWDKAYGGEKSDSLTAIIATPDGGFLLGGSSASGSSGDKSQPSKGNKDYWILKIDASGTQLWNKTYGGSAADNLTSLLATPDGGFLLGGSSASNLSGDKSQSGKGSNDYWLVKINATGTKLWDQTYGGSDADNLTAIVAAANGGYLLGGSSFSGKSGDKSQANRGLEDYWVLRIREDGSKLWDKTFGGLKETYQQDECYAEDPADCFFDVGNSVLSALLATPDGGYLLGGFSNADKGGDKTDDNLGRDSYNARLRDYWIIKINSSGTKVWDKTYGGISAEKSTGPGGFYFTGNSVLRTIIATPEGDYLLAGTSDSDKGRDKSENTRVGERYTYPAEGGGYYIFFPGEEDYWIVKIDKEGTKKWDRTIGSRDYDALQAIVPTLDGGYVLGGTSTATGIGGDKTEVARDTNNLFSNSKGDYWLVKIKDETPSVTAAWDMRFGGVGTDNFTVAIKTSDGGYLSGGYSNSGNSGDKSQNSQGKNDYWIVKSDKNGKKLWDKRFGGAADDYLNRVIQTSDGGYLLGGSSLSGSSGDKTEVSRGNRDYWVVKVDAAGAKQWDKRFGGSGYDELEKVIQLASGEYVLGGYSNSPVSGDKSQASQGGNDYWLVKISNTGTKLWDQRYGGNQEETLGSLTETRDNGFLLGGSSFSGTSGDKSQANRGGSDYWVVKTDKEGNLLWDKTFGGSGPDEAYSVGRSGSDFFIAGTSNSGRSGEKSQDSQGGKDYWLIKLDASGDKLWDKRFGGSANDELRASTFTNEGHYVLAGKSFSGASGDKSQSNQGGSDYWIVQVDSDGNKVYDKRYGGSGTEELRTVFQTSDGGLLLGGRSNSGVSGDRSQPSQGGTDYWLVKVVPVTSSMLAAREATLAEEPARVEAVSLQAYPNPFAERATVNFSLPETQTATVKVYDSQGREVATLFQGEAKVNQVYQVEWKANNQAAGMYLLQLQTLTKRHQQKLMLTK